MAVSRDIFSHHDLGVGFHCQLVGRDHGCCSVPNDTQDSPAQQRIIQSKMSIALRLRNPGTILWGAVRKEINWGDNAGHPRRSIFRVRNGWTLKTSVTYLTM